MNEYTHGMKEGAIMSRAMNTARIQRLNALLKALKSAEYISREELMTRCNYVSSRTLESDLRFLRRSFGAKIHYSRSKSAYSLESVGDFVLWQ